MSFATHWRFLRKRKNKLLYAVTHNTAAEIASSRADASKAKYGSYIMEGNQGAFFPVFECFVDISADIFHIDAIFY